MKVHLFISVMHEMNAATDEASSTVILYLSPSLHHLPCVSEGQETSSDGDMLRQLSVEPVNRHLLPASSEPLQSCVVSPVISTVQGTLQPAVDAVSSAANRQLDMRTEGVTDVIQYCPDYSDGSSSVQSGLKSKPTETAVLNVEDVGQQHKVSNAFLL